MGKIMDCTMSGTFHHFNRLRTYMDKIIASYYSGVIAKNLSPKRQHYKRDFCWYDITFFICKNHQAKRKNLITSDIINLNSMGSVGTHGQCQWWFSMLQNQEVNQEARTHFWYRLFAMWQILFALNSWSLCFCYQILLISVYVLTAWLIFTLN